jgi:TRAP-type mannitol/chloroaromatic compound transport system permease small subunit
VDSYTEHLPLRRKAWLELIGCLVLALPYCALVAYHSLDFVGSSYALAEQSDSTIGLRYRWFIKGIYAAGLWLVVLGILSVLLRIIVFLFGQRSPEEVNLQIGHTVVDV